MDPTFRGTRALRRAHDSLMRKRTAKMTWAEVERPGDVGMDLPAGVTAEQLKPTDYHPVEMEQAAETAAPKKSRLGAKVRRALHHR